MRRFALTFCAYAVLAACSSNGTLAGPHGWKQDAKGVWVNPAAPAQNFHVVSGPYDGTLKDLASQTTTDVILQQQVKYRSAVPFSPCPGEAGLQTFGSSAPKGKIVEAAFSVQNGKKVVAEYIRPATEREDPAAIDALAANVCTVP